MKNSKKSTSWGVQVAALVLALLLFSVLGLVAVAHQVEAAQSAAIPTGTTSSASQSVLAASPSPVISPTNPPPTEPPVTVTVPPTQAPTATQPPAPTNGPKPIATPTKRAVFPTATATAQPSPTVTTTPIETVTVDAATPTPTTVVSISSANSTNSGGSGGGPGGIVPGVWLAVIGIAIMAGIVVLLIVMMRRMSEGTRIAGLPGARYRNGGAVIATAVLAGPPVVFESARSVQPTQAPQSLQQAFPPQPHPSLMHGVGEIAQGYRPSHGGMAPLMSDSIATQVVQQHSVSEGKGTSDMNPLALDFQQIVGTNNPASEAFPLAAQMGILAESQSSSIEDATVPVQSVSAIPPVQEEEVNNFLSEQAISSEAEEVVDAAPPALPWDLQPGMSGDSQDDPLLAALKREVQGGLFSIPDKEKDGDEKQEES